MGEGCLLPKPERSVSLVLLSNQSADRCLQCSAAQCGIKGTVQRRSSCAFDHLQDGSDKTGRALTGCMRFIRPSHYTL